MTLGSPTVDCPHCDSAQAVEPLGGGRYLCPCCGREFEWRPEPTMRAEASGRVRAQQRGKSRQDRE